MSSNIGESRKKFSTGKNFLIKAEKAIYKESYKKAFNFLAYALAIFNELNSHLMIARVHFLEGYIFEQLNELEKTLESYKLSLEHRKIAGTPLIIAETEKKIAETYLNMKNYEEAHIYAQTSIDILENENYPFAKADSLYTKGTIYFAEKDWKSTIFYYKLASDYLKSQYHWKLFLKINENLGKAYKKLGNYVESNRIFKKALKLENEKKNHPVIIAILKEMAENYKFLNNKKKAVDYIKDAIEMDKKLQKIRANEKFTSILIQLVEILFYFNDLDEAEKICEDIIEFAETHNHKSYLIQGLILSVKIFLSNDKMDEQNFELIRKYIDEALYIAKSLQNSKNIIEILIQKIRLYQKMNADKEKILEILRTAEKIALKSALKCSLGDVYEQYGLYYHSLDLEKANKYFILGLDEYIKCDSIQDQAEMHYNISCISSLLNSFEDMIDHLTTSIELNSKFKEIAREDEDFKEFKNQELFKNIIK